MRPDILAPRPARVLGAVATVVLAAAVLTGCGGDDTSNATSQAATTAGTAPAVITVLTRKQATAALLTGQNLGGGFAVVDQDDDGEGSLGCLDVLNDIETDAAAVAKERSFDAVGQIPLPSVTTGVYSYDDVLTASAPFQAALAALEDCKRVDETNEDGTRFKLKVHADSGTATPDADEQVNLSATGSVTMRGSTAPVGIWFSVARIDNHVVSVIFVDLSVDTGAAAAAALTRAAVGRLLAVVADDEPSQTLVDVGAGAAV